MTHGIIGFKISVVRGRIELIRHCDGRFICVRSGDAKPDSVINFAVVSALYLSSFVTVYAGTKNKIFVILKACIHGAFVMLVYDYGF